MKVNGNIWGILCGILLVSLLAGCKSPAGTATTSAGIMKTEEAFFTSVVDHTFRFNTLSARLKLEFSGLQQEFSSRVNLKMIYDDRMQLSIQPLLGIEVFRIEISTDSVKILDRMNKRYMVDSYDNLKGKTEIDFNFQNLQALFTNQVFVPGENEISTKHFRRFRMTKDDNAAKLKLKDSNGILYTFTAGADEKLLSTYIENPSNKQSITWDYNDFNIVNKQQFPMKMTARLLDADISQGTAILTFSSPEINSPLTTDFKIPSGYERVTSEQIIKLLRKK
jgi:hypothetical protein